MLFTSPKKEKKNIDLKGAVQINHSSFFVYKGEDGNTFLNAGRDDRLHTIYGIT